MIIFILINGCLQKQNEKYRDATIHTRYVLPDSNKQKVLDFVERITKNTNNNLHTSDYERPWKVIETAKKEAESIYEIEEDYLTFYNIDGALIYLYQNKFNKEDSLFYQKLKNKR